MTKAPGFIIGGLALLLLAPPLGAQVSAPVLFDEDGKAVESGERGEDDDGTAEELPADEDELPGRIDPSVPRAADDARPSPRAPRPAVAPAPPGDRSATGAPRGVDKPVRDRDREAGPGPGRDREREAPAAAGPAEPEEPGAGDAEEAAGDGEAMPEGFGTVEALADVYGPILALWQQRRDALLAHKAVEANAHLTEIASRLQRLGGGGPLGSSLRDIGTALSREAVRALDERDTMRALGLAEISIELAPDVPLVHLTLAQVRFRHSPADVIGVVSAVRQAVVAAAADLAIATALVLSLAVFATAALLVALFLVVLVYFARGVRLLVHDVRHLMPRGVSTLQAAVLVGVLALLPVLFRLGPLFTCLWLLLLTWAYLSRRERAALSTLWALMVLVPLLVMGGTRLLGPDMRLAAQIHRATRDVGMRDARMALERQRAQNPDDPLLLGAIALLDKRDGALDRAKEGLTRALAKAPDQAWLHNNMGNILALQGDVDGALAEYARAVDLAPAFIEAHFNTANLYFRVKRMSQGRSAASTAMAIDEATFNRLQEVTGSGLGASHNQTVVDVSVPTRALVEAALARGRDVERYQRQAASYLFFGLPPPYMAVAVLAALLLLLLYGRALRRLRPSHACPRCGNAACVRCDHDVPTHDVCGQCYHAFLAPSRSIDANLKIRKEIEVRRFRARREILRRFTSLVVAGVAHLLSGAPLRGVLAVFSFAVLLTGVLSLWGWIPMPFSTGVSFPLLRVIALGVLLLLLYAWSFLSALRLEG